MRIAYIGNFAAPHSTENHVARAFEHNGHIVQRLQENEWAEWNTVPMEPFDFLLWTRTGWDWPHYGLSHAEAKNLQFQMLMWMRRLQIPTVGFHLDIWWGLEREHQVAEEPFFQVDLLATADGGHDENWTEAGVNHVWMPPGVSLAECEPGMYRSDIASPVAFVGSWQGSYHQESKHRHELVQWLKDNFRRDCAFWPRTGEPAARGSLLRDLYQSVDVLVGDSCFSGTGLPRYISDRAFETPGRGGLLVHPRVEGVTDGSAWRDVTMLREGEDLLCWDAFDWADLGDKIEWALTHPAERKEIAAVGRAHVMAEHTYEVRTNQLIEILYERKMLKRPRKASAK